MNILLITTDQQRADSIGAYGNPVCQTPNLDRLASEGTTFTSARTQNPFCQPARATILTSTLPSTHGVTFNGRDLPAQQAERSVATAFARGRAPDRLLRQGALRHHLPVPADRAARVGGGIGAHRSGLERALLRLRRGGRSSCSATTCAPRR